MELLWLRVENIFLKGKYPYKINEKRITRYVKLYISFADCGVLQPSWELSNQIKLSIKLIKSDQMVKSWFCKNLRLLEATVGQDMFFRAGILQVSIAFIHHSMEGTPLESAFPSPPEQTSAYHSGSMSIPVGKKKYLNSESLRHFVSIPESSRCFFFFFF